MIRMQLCEPQLFRKLNLAISFTYAKSLDLVSKHAHCPLQHLDHLYKSSVRRFQAPAGRLHGQLQVAQTLSSNG